MAGKTLTPYLTLFICPDSKILADAERASAETQLVKPAKSLDHYPSPQEFEDILEQLQPEVLMLSTANFDRALELIERAAAVSPAARVVILGEPAPEHVPQLVRPQIAGIVTLPVTAEKIATALIRLRQTVAFERPSSERILAFMPAKAGTGASTVALNTALALGRRGHHRVLLADFDLAGGVLDFMLATNSAHTAADVAENLQRLEASHWNDVVASVHGIDFLRSPRSQRPLALPHSNLRILAGFLRRRYDAAIIDLPASPDQAALDLLPEADRLFLVTTPETSSLRVAREKMQFLRDLGVADRVRIVVNRWPGRSHVRGVVNSLSDVENILGLPPVTAFSNDYSGVQSALLEGRGVAGGSTLGGQYRTFASGLLESKPAVPGGVRYRFFERFFVGAKKMQEYASR